MVNPIALSYAKLKQFHNNPQYNPGMEAVYNRAMSAPVAPNIGGEIIRNILGAYVGSKLGEGKQNYIASQQEKERQNRLTDEKSMLDYRVGLEDKQKEAERQRLYQGLLGMGSPESFSPTTGEQWATPAPVKGVPEGLTADTYSKMAERKLLPEKPSYSYQTVKEKGGPMLYEVEAGGKKRLIGVAPPTNTSLFPEKMKQAQNDFYMRQRDSLMKDRTALALKKDTFGRALTPAEEQKLTGLDSEIEWYNAQLGIPQPPQKTGSTVPEAEKSTVGKIWGSLFGSTAPAPAPAVSLEQIDAEMKKRKSSGKK